MAPSCGNQTHTGEVKSAGFLVKEIITDKDSSICIVITSLRASSPTVSTIHCQAPTQDLQKIQQNKCEVKGPVQHGYSLL